MADLAPVYLICGDDDSKLDAWRTRARVRSEAEQGPGALESFDARTARPEAVAAALATLTFTTGTRYLLVDDVGAWKAGDLDPLTAAIATLPADLVLVLIVRGKPLKGLVKAVEKAGGEQRAYPAPKSWEMPGWIVARAKELGLRVDLEAATELLKIVGPSKTRLTRELEKLAIGVHPATAASADDVERIAAGDTQPKVYDLADALVVGDLEGTLRLAEGLADAGEEPSRLIYPVVGRLREVRTVVGLLESGVAESAMAKQLRAPPWRVKKAVALARNADRATLERALCRFADLELELRGGGNLDEETAVTLTLAGAAA